mmetsp:Transcript_13160/g.26778  ORF Transcript_13160/g.26778 Transcript_13160/m.26778 type:complete len:541 (-) Transcript_13160:389-2011(-)
MVHLGNGQIEFVELVFFEVLGAKSCFGKLEEVGVGFVDDFYFSDDFDLLFFFWFHVCWIVIVLGIEVVSFVVVLLLSIDFHDTSLCFFNIVIPCLQVDPVNIGQPNLLRLSIHKLGIPWKRLAERRIHSGDVGHLHEKEKEEGVEKVSLNVAFSSGEEGEVVCWWCMRLLARSLFWNSMLLLPLLLLLLLLSDIARIPRHIAPGSALLLLLLLLHLPLPPKTLRHRHSPGRTSHRRRRRCLRHRRRIEHEPTSTTATAGGTTRALPFRTRLSIGNGGRLGRLGRALRREAYSSHDVVGWGRGRGGGGGGFRGCGRGAIRPISILGFALGFASDGSRSGSVLGCRFPIAISILVHFLLRRFLFLPFPTGNTFALRHLLARPSPRFHRSRHAVANLAPFRRLSRRRRRSTRTPRGDAPSFASAGSHDHSGGRSRWGLELQGGLRVGGFHGARGDGVGVGGVHVVVFFFVFVRHFVVVVVVVIAALAARFVGAAVVIGSGDGFGDATGGGVGEGGCRCGGFGSLAGQLVGHVGYVGRRVRIRR